jgi:hypothetical protein
MRCALCHEVIDEAKEPGGKAYRALEKGVEKTLHAECCYEMGIQAALKEEKQGSQEPRLGVFGRLVQPFKKGRH